MPKKSRIKRLGAWLSTTAHAIGALFYPPNIKNALTNVTKNYKEYICFYLAALCMGTGFWVLSLSTESNLVEARERVNDAYDYHVEMVVPNEETYVNLDNRLAYEVNRENEYIASFYWAYNGGSLPDGSYVVRILLAEEPGLPLSYAEVKADILRKTAHETIRLSPLYSFEDDFVRPYTTQLWVTALIWFAFSVVMMLVLFLIRLDHFRFLYGIYMTCGADFPKLMGAAGGELTTIYLMTCLPSALIGGGIAAALYIPRGVGLHPTVRAVLLPLLGGFLAVFCAVWFPMRRLSKQAPIRHLATEDNTGLVSSPRRSFFLFGESFPGKYELYGFWRMRKYYLRLVLSAVLFASVFVSGLYIADMVQTHNQTDPGEYLLSYAPMYTPPVEAESESGDEGETSEPSFTMDDEEAEILWSDLPLFIEDIDAVPGVSHMEWDVSLSGGHTASHILLKPGQLYSSGRYTVASRERASEGFKWAANNYAYTAIDEAWIDNQLKHGLCTFDGDPYAALTEENHIIISEDVYNKKTYDFKPGDTVMVAVCEKVNFTELVTDSRELLRGQIRENVFRYEAFTVAAVMRDMDSSAYITLGVPFEQYRLLTGETPVRAAVTVYMDSGTDLDTVRAAEGEIRRILMPIMGWSVTPTGNYFDAQVRGLKSDAAVVLSLAACLLIISPMVWYFSQILFYRKRRGEYAVLHALGAPDTAFAKMHRLTGGVLSGVAFLVTVLLSLGLNYLVWFAVNTLLPTLHLIESRHYTFGLSWPALIVCVLVSVLCGYLSCEFAYRLYARRDAQSDTIDL